MEGCGMMGSARDGKRRDGEMGVVDGLLGHGGEAVHEVFRIALPPPHS